MIVKDRSTQFWWVGIVVAAAAFQALHLISGTWSEGRMISSMFSAVSMILILSALNFPGKERPSLRRFLQSWKLYAGLVFLLVPSTLRIW